MDGAVLILSHEVIPRQVEVLDCERTVIGHSVGAHRINLDLSEIADQRESGRVEVPAHMEEPDRPGSRLHPGALTHRPDLNICRLELVTILVPLVEGFKKRRTAHGIDGVPQTYDGPFAVAERGSRTGMSQCMGPRGMLRSSAGRGEGVGWHTPGNHRETCAAKKHP